MMDDWPDFERHLRQRLNAAIDAQPESLLETDNGPIGMKADIILARLLGFDDQIVSDTMRLRRVEPLLETPIPERLTLATLEPEPGDYVPLRTARYVLQSGYVTMQVDPVAVPLPGGVKVGPPDFRATVLFVRYRRRS